MKNTSHGYEDCLASLVAVAGALKLRMSDLETWHSTSGRSAKVSGRTTDGRFLSVRVIIASSTPAANESSGSDMGLTR